MTKRKKQITLFVSVLITLLVVYYVYLNIEISDLLSIFQNADWAWLFFGLTIYFANYAMRAVRFNLLLQYSHPNFWKMWAITSMYGMYNYLMPVKSGEFSFIALAKNKLGVDISRSTAVLVVTRLFDFVLIALFIPFVLAVFWNELSSTLIIIFIVYCLIVFLVLVYFIRWLKGFSPITQGKEVGNDGKFAQILHRLKTGMYVVEQRKLYIPLFLSTALIWFLIGLNFYSIVIAMGTQISLIQAIVISVFMIPTTLLPIQGFANVGTHELGWVAAFALFDYPNSVALNIALGSHGILLVFVLLLGLTGFIVEILDRNTPVNDGFYFG